MVPCLNEQNNTIIQICSEDMRKPDSKFLKYIAPKLLGLWSWTFNTSYIMKLSTTFLFTTTTENIIYTTKIIAQAKLHM